MFFFIIFVVCIVWLNLGGVVGVLFLSLCLCDIGMFVVIIIMFLLIGFLGLKDKIRIVWLEKMYKKKYEVIRIFKSKFRW